MPIINETLATGVFVSFYVYDPKGILLHTEQNEMFLDSYNKETKTGLFRSLFPSQIILSADEDAYFLAYGSFSFNLEPLYHGASVSGVSTLPSGSVSCKLSHKLFTPGELNSELMSPIKTLQVGNSYFIAGFNP